MILRTVGFIGGKAEGSWAEEWCGKRSATRGSVTRVGRP